MKKNKKYIWIFIFIFIASFLSPFFNSIDMDMIWNYGFSFNFANGLIPYKDYNMVITPLYPMINGTIMMIFGKNMLVFYLANSCLITGIMYLVYKINKNIMIPIFIALILFTNPNYNMLCVFFCILLLYLEGKKDTNDYLIGIMLGLTFLTKSSIGVCLCIPTLFTKNIKKIFKRIIGFIIPNLIIFIWYYFNGSLMKYIDYVFLGLLDFADKNTKLSIFIIVSILIIGFLIYKYIKTKDIKLLYLLCFQIMCYPLFNTYHFIYSFIPILVYFLDKIKIIQSKPFKIAFCVLLIVPIGSVIIKSNLYSMKKNNYFKYRYVQQSTIIRLDELNKLIKYDNKNRLYFINTNGYLYKLAYDIKINDLDLLMNGNMGYNGSKKALDKIKSLPVGSLFVIENFEQIEQFDISLSNYIINNYVIRDQSINYTVYKKTI